MKLSISPLSQRDSKWRSLKMPGGGTLGDYGCLVTALSMQFGTTPDQLITKDIFNGNYVDWNKLTNVYSYTFERAEGLSQTGYKNIIKERLEKGYPTVFEVDFDNNVAGKQQHFVLAIGYDSDILLNDPWTGETYYLSASYRDILSLRMMTPKNQPLDPLKECLKQHSDLLDQLKAKDEEIAKIQKEKDKYSRELARVLQELSDSKPKIKVLKYEATKNKEKIGSLKRDVASWQASYESANKEIEKLQEELETCQGQKAQFEKWYKSALEKSADKLKFHELLVLMWKKIFQNGEKAKKN